MSEISLKEYFAKLNTLLSANAADEVIHHCRHILQYYPKNVTAYRFLGRALVINGRWDEGRDTLRRVLSVIPDDYVAHLGLSEANERMNRPDEAIWHLERAFEQRPNDKELIDALRGLYRRYRSVENLKVQLTAAAVARQYLRSGAYSQAIDSLRSALARMSERLDLRLLLAQILWQNGSEEESAEITIEVLKVLPDCLEANRIMAKLWLSEDRPSDAQRYVNHLEAVDPYLAVELVQGYAPDDDVFSLEELDYVRSAQSEMASARPDWLQEISISPVQASEAEKQTANADAWSNWSSAMLNSQAPAEAQTPSAPQPTSARFAAMAQNEEALNTGGLTDLFGKPEEGHTDELSALFEAEESSEDDPMAWLHKAGAAPIEEDEEEPSYENLFAADVDDSPLPSEDDPMAWLQGSNSDLILEDDAPAEQPAAADDDLFAWMQAQPDEPEEEAPEFAAESGDSLGWLQDDHLLDEAFGLENLDENAVGDDTEPTLGDQPTPDEAPVPGPRRGLTAMLQESNFDWNKQPEEEPLVSDNELDDWLNQFGPTEPRKSPTDVPDWLTQLETPETESATSLSAVSEEAQPDDDWLAQFAPDSAQPPQGGSEAEAATDVPDWLSELAPQPDEPQSEPDAEAVTGEVPEWLSELDPEQNKGEAEPEPESEPDTEAEPSADTEFTWMSDLEAEPEAVSGDVPDWLSELDPEQNKGDSQPEAEPESEPESDAEAEPSADAEFTWMTDLEAEPDSEAQAETEEVPDWLSELAPKPSEPEPDAEAEPLADAEFTWMSDEVLATAETEAEAVSEEVPDWLSELAPQQSEPETEPEAEPLADAEFTWMSDEVLASAEPDAESDAVSEEVPDWLSELAPKPSEPEPEAEPLADAEFTWMSDEVLASAEPDAESDAVSEDVPDWLSELEPKPSEPEPEAEPSSDAEFTWMSDEALADAEAKAEAEPEALRAEEVPDWLNELEPEPIASELEPTLSPEPNDDLAWLDEPDTASEDQELEPAAQLDSDDESAEEEAQPVAEPVGAPFDDEEQIGENDQESPQEGDEILEPTPAQNAPDWLNAMVPGLDVDYEASEPLEEEEEEPAADKREFAWLVEMVEAETAATERPTFVFSRPPAWLEPADALTDGADVDDDLPDWPSDDADADVPEWLR